MKLLFFIAFAILSPAIKAQTAEVTPSQADGIRHIRMEAVTDRIIHVRATAEESFPTKQSLIVVPQTGRKPRASITKENGAVVLRTKELKARIDSQTGRVAFYDNTGKEIYFTPLQRQLMQMLILAPSHQIEKSAICNALWPNKPDASETLYTLIRRLKPIVEQTSELQIECVRGRAYRLVGKMSDKCQ